MQHKQAKSTREPQKRQSGQIRFVQDRGLDRSRSVLRGSIILMAAGPTPIAPCAQAPASTPQDDARAWLAAFHAGDRDVLEGCYRTHFQRVDLSVGKVLRGADKETVVQELFLQLLSNGELRRSFSGGAFAAWIATLARNRAIDFWRRYRRERGLEEAPDDTACPDAAAAIEARMLVAQFVRDELPAKWRGVFETRFLAELDQRSAARRLGISRTTLAYREIQVRRLLKRFLFRRGET
jgi:RNA polymerase sigma-70 factor (ECF subfamily)